MPHKVSKQPHSMSDYQERRLKEEHKELFHHWSDKVGLDVNPTISENTCTKQYINYYSPKSNVISDKHHVARLFDVYTHHKTTIDHKNPVQDARRPSPITKLYGVKGTILHILVSVFD
jgi:hypothetical protein